MFRGIISGGLTGLVLSGLVLATASLLAPQPAGNRPPEPPQVDVAVADGGDLTLGSAPEPAAPVVESAGEVALPQVDLPEAAPGLPVADTTPAALPQAAGLDGALPVPPEGAVAGAEAGSDPAREEPVQSNPQIAAPQVPLQEAAPALSTTPAAPPVMVEEQAPAVVLVPEAAESETAAVEPEITEVEEELPRVAIDATVDPAVDAGEDSNPLVILVPEVLVEEPVSDLSEPAQDGPAMTAPEEPGEARVVLPEPEVAPAMDPVPGDTPEVVAEDIEIAPEIAAENDEAAAPAALPGVIGLRGEGSALPAGESGVRVNRLTEQQPEADAPAVVQDDGAVVDGPALRAFAGEYENPADLPLMSVVLIDDGSIAGAVPLIAGLPFPVSVALDPELADARARMEEYRAAGIEVLALTRMPVGAQPIDVEVNLEAVFLALPQAVALLDAGDGGMQTGSAVAAQAMGRLAVDGRGVVTVAQGLNSALREADAAGVPAVSVYRDLDSGGQDARVISRFLDQAAFRARQESGVVLLGRVRADTVSALILWGTQNRAGQVAMVPVSAVLLPQ